MHLCGAGADSFASLLLERLTPVPVSLDHIISGQFQVNVAADILEYAEISHCLSTLLLELLRARALAAASGPTVRKDEISALAEYIARHYDQPLTLDDCIRVARLSRYYLIRLFRQQMGMPPCQYLHKCRINRAQELLRSTQDSIGRIGAQVGYADPVVFIRHFRRMVGVTPSVYRKESTVMPGRR
ncbi:MAG: helix-turn-helix domain-containing protein [Aristaeellaceae bacterium]